MLPGGLDPIYRRILSAAHEPFVRVEVWSQGARIAALSKMDEDDRGDDSLVYLSGSSVQATLTAQVSRNLTLNVPWHLYPSATTDLLNPYSREIRVWRGVRAAGVTTPYGWQIFRGRIQQVSRDRRIGFTTVTCADRGQDVLDAGFVNPQNSVSGNPLNIEFQRLVRGAVPDAEFGVSDTFAETTQALAWEFNRAGAVEEMFSSAGALWYALADGKFVARRFPWAIPGAPLLTLTDGPGGVVLSAREARSRSDMYNVVTATGERLNGDAPVTATAKDDRPGSVTDVNGGFGIKSRLMRRQSPSTQGGAQAAAEAALRTAITPTETVGWDQSPDASTELGDVVALDVNDRTGIIQVISSFSMPLDIGPPMAVQGRSQVIGQVESGGF
jgi:hypothetical protein